MTLTIAATSLDGLLKITKADSGTSQYLKDLAEKHIAMIIEKEYALSAPTAPSATAPSATAPSAPSTGGQTADAQSADAQAQSNAFRFMS